MNDKDYCKKCAQLAKTASAKSVSLTVSLCEMGNKENTRASRVRACWVGLSNGSCETGTAIELPAGKQILNIASKIRIGSSKDGGVDWSKSPKRQSLSIFKNPLASKNWKQIVVSIQSTVVKLLLYCDVPVILESNLLFAYLFLPAFLICNISVLSVLSQHIAKLNPTFIPSLRSISSLMFSSVINQSAAYNDGTISCDDCSSKFVMNGSDGLSRPVRLAIDVANSCLQAWD